MNIKTYFAEKLAGVFFINVKNQVLNNTFGTDIQGEFYVPLISTEMVEKIQNGEDFSNISILLFLEGMCYVLGADEKFKYNTQYLKMISSKKDYINFIKKDIYDNVKIEKYDTAYILLKGLSLVENNQENCKKLLDLADYLRCKNSFFKEEEMEIINKGKEGFHLPEAYYYESIIKNLDGDYDGALISIQEYISSGGDKTKEALELSESLKVVSDFSKGKTEAYDNPEKALKLLLPLLKKFPDNTELHYYIAICYRQLHNYEKAIYYLNETLSIDSGYVDVFNEMGINYAYLGEYDTAVRYLKKAFEATKSVEICSNLIMCFINMGKIDEAKAHLAIAEKLSPNDDIIEKIKKRLN